MTDEKVISLYQFYIKEIFRLSNVMDRTKKQRVKSKLFDRIMKLKDRYDWTFDEIYRRRLLQFRNIELK